jgi:hypothetical protein
MNAPTHRRTLDIRVLTVFLVLTCLLGVGTHFLHGYQVNRNAEALLEQANRAEADNDADKFADYLGRYVGLRPDDLDAASRFAVMLEQRAKSPLQRYRAFLALEDVLRRDTISERPEVRLRAARSASVRKKVSNLPRRGQRMRPRSKQIRLVCTLPTS